MTFNRYSLVFHDAHLERKYLQESLKSNIGNHIISSFILLTTNIFSLALSSKQNDYLEFGDRNFNYTSLAISCILLVWIFFARSDFFERNFQNMTKLVLFFSYYIFFFNQPLHKIVFGHNSYSRVIDLLRYINKSSWIRTEAFGIGYYNNEYPISPWPISKCGCRNNFNQPPHAF